MRSPRVRDSPGWRSLCRTTAFHCGASGAGAFPPERFLVKQSRGRAKDAQLKDDGRLEWLASAIPAQKSANAFMAMKQRRPLCRDRARERIPIVLVGHPARHRKLAPADEDAPLLDA